MQNKIHFILMLLTSSLVFTQNYNTSVTGKVIDKNSGKPLLNSNIYLSGTMWGTTSNENGIYNLMSVIPAEYQIVFSMVGYETQAKTVLVMNNRTIEIDVMMVPVSYELDSITIHSDVPESWYENLRTFKEYFLGDTEYADECIIRNEIYLEFSNPVPNKLYAKISRPLEIINNALGFKIECELISFSYESNEGRLKYFITSHFEEIDTNDQNVLLKWEKNRIEAYRGSMDHFLYCLKYNKFIDEGFEVSTSIFPSNSGHDLYRKMIFSADSLLTNPASAENSILIFNKFLQVEYNHSDKQYKPISWLRILGSYVTLDRYGIPLETMPFEVHGDWSHYGISAMLPRYYFAVSKN